MKKLDDIPKNNVFLVPDHYFEKLQLDIQHKIRPSKEIVKWPFVFKPVWKYALAFSLLGIVFLVIKPTPSHQSPEEMLADVSEAQLTLFMEENEEIESIDILQVLDFVDEENQLNESKIYGDNIE